MKGFMYELLLKFAESKKALAVISARALQNSGLF